MLTSGYYTSILLSGNSPSIHLIMCMLLFILLLCRSDRLIHLDLFWAPISESGMNFFAEYEHLVSCYIEFNCLAAYGT